MEVEEDGRQPDIDMGGVTLTARDPKARKPRKKKSKKLALDEDAAGPSLGSFTGEAGITDGAGRSEGAQVANVEEEDLEVPASPLIWAS